MYDAIEKKDTIVWLLIVKIMIWAKNVERKSTRNGLVRPPYKHISLSICFVKLVSLDIYDTSIGAMCPVFHTCLFVYVFVL